MALNPRSKQWNESSARNYLSSGGDEDHTGIPSEIIVPRHRPCRVTSSMEQHYREMPGDNNTSADGKSKPWQVDIARKSYSSRRFRRPNKRRVQPPAAPSLPPAPETPPVATVAFNRDSISPCVAKGSPELDGSWKNNYNDDGGYPSDEENGFGGGYISQSSSSPSNSYIGDQSPTGMPDSHPVKTYMYYYRPS